MNALYASALSAIQAGRWEEAQRHLLGIDKEEPGFKDVRQLLGRASEEVEQIKQKHLAALYGQAIQAVNAQNWAEAQSLFRQLEQEAPGYHDVRRQLKRVEAEIERRQALIDEQNHMASVYDRAMEAMRANQWTEAQSLLLQLEVDAPGYRDVRQKLAQVNNLVKANQPVPAPSKPAGRSKTLLIGIAIGASLVVCACMTLIWLSSSGGYY